MANDKIPVYLMPGMAASPLIFNHLSLSPRQFKVTKLEWFIPQKNQSFSDYAAQMCKLVTDENPVLIGVSFGGMLVQQMAEYIPCKKVIGISTIKLSSEMPARLKWARRTKLYKIIPTSLLTNVDFLAKYAFGETITKRLDLYKQYMAVNHKTYIDWAIANVVNWQATQVASNFIHIHGDKDAVFPIKRIKDCVTVKNGTHTMIIHRAKWFNEHLPTLILN